VALFKRQGGVKDKTTLGSAEAPLVGQRGWGPRLWKSHAESPTGGSSFHQPSIRPEPRPWFQRSQAVGELSGTDRRSTARAGGSGWDRSYKCLAVISPTSPQKAMTHAKIPFLASLLSSLTFWSGRNTPEPATERLQVKEE